MKEPKFKVGQVLKHSFKATVMEIDDDGYHCDNAYIPFTAESMWELSEEHASEDLEEYYKKEFLPNEWFAKSGQRTISEFNFFTAKHFAEWGRKKDQETIELAEDHAMLAGMEKMRGEMMKDAVEAEVMYPASSSTLQIRYKLPKNTKLKYGDKVKIIIIKEK